MVEEYIEIVCCSPVGTEEHRLAGLNCLAHILLIPVDIFLIPGRLLPFLTPFDISGIILITPYILTGNI
jgi:hypothetical protein